MKISRRVLAVVLLVALIVSFPFLVLRRKTLGGKVDVSTPLAQNGFALVDVFSPCVTYNKDNTYQWFNPRVKILEEQGHDPTDLHKAIDRGYQWGEEIPIGLFWRRTDLETLEELEPVLHTGEGPLGFRRKIGIAVDQAKALVNELL